MDDASNFRAVQVSVQRGQAWAPRPSSEPRTCEWRPWATAPLAQLDFRSLPKHAMSVIGFSEEEIRQVLEVTALVLKLGNVKLTDEFQANGIPASGICDGKGWCYLPGARHESPTLSPVCEPRPT